MSDRPIDLRGVHDAVRIVRNDIASSLALLSGDTLAGIRLRATLDS
jgi:hypothetical protein